MKKALVVGVILLALVIAACVWFWSLGSVPKEETPRIVVRTEQAGVDVRRNGSDQWYPVAAETDVTAGDEVRTNETGRAVIRFYGRGETRLQENSDVKIEQADQADTAPFVMRLQLITGRIWSRVIRLFDLDSSFSVRTDRVVATVRGTAFDMTSGANGTALLVADASVELAGAERDFIVPEGFKTALDPSLAWGPTDPVTAEDGTSDWALRNANADAAFGKAVTDSISSMFERRGRVRPDQALGGLISLSERAHLALAGTGAPRLQAQYFGRRIYGVKTLVDDGKSGLAFQAYAVLEQELREILPTPAGAALAPHLRAETDDLTVLLHDVTPSSPLYRLKLKLEDLNQLLVADDAADALFARMLSAEARLDEASNLIASRQLEEASLSMDAASQGIANVERDLDPVASSTTAERAHALRMKLQALRAREAAMQVRMTAALYSPTETTGTETASSTTDGTGTSTPSNGAAPPSDGTPPPAEPVPPPVSEAPWDRIAVAAQPNPVETGGTTQLRVTGSRADGTTGDLTARASFRLIGNLGSLNGPTFTASQAGSVTLEASVADNGVTKTALTVIQVNEAVKLTRLEIIPQGSATVVQGGQVGIAAKAWYSSGLTSIVTAKTVWTTSDANIGSVSGGVFHAWTNGLGNVTITGAYSENGVTVSGEAVFTVTQAAATGR